MGQIGLMSRVFANGPGDRRPIPIYSYKRVIWVGVSQ